MPPSVTDELSDSSEAAPPVSSKRNKKHSIAAASRVDDEDDDEMLDVVGNGSDGDEGEGDEEEDLDEDEYIVEKILAHVLEANGTLKYKVKWEGYEKKADQTWEEEENLRENAAEVLDEYLESIGGREKIFEEANTALKNKKRGRTAAAAAAAAAAASTSSNGTKRRRNEDHPASTTPPASVSTWKPPQGSWEDDVETIDACHDEKTGKIIVYLTWKGGQKTQHDTKVIYSRCPQKMLQFYERHVKIVSTGDDGHD
ncbi:heterochromatin protein one [Xylaria sp. CBS 124048]|nr:heterochromatin protein one [Xylaria sp. CBS 124048]